MAKITIIFGEHPTEKVGRFHARMAARLLKQKYGHDVKLVRIPIEETNYGIVHNHDAEDAAKTLAFIPDSYDRAEELRDKGRFSFNFHCIENEHVGQAPVRAPKDFRVAVYNSWNRRIKGFPKEVCIMSSGRPSKNKSFVVELPAFFTALPKEFFERNKEKTGAVWSYYFQNRGALLQKESIRRNLSSVYHHDYAPLHHPSQKKFLDRVITEKIAEAIHGIVSKKRK